MAPAPKYMIALYLGVCTRVYKPQDPKMRTCPITFSNVFRCTPGLKLLADKQVGSAEIYKLLFSM